MVTCDQITEATKVVLRTYDLNNDGYLSKDESVAVVRDYFNNVPGITQEVAVGAASAYELQCDISKSMTCDQITEAQKVVLRTYDSNNDGYLSKDDAVATVRDYMLTPSLITKEEALAATVAYNLQCDIGKTIVPFVCNIPKCNLIVT